MITGKQVRQSKGWTDKFIHPPQTVRVVDILLENFHLPQSTMLMLVCAFGERDFVMKGYKKAIKEKYRFYDFGDAMLII